MTPSLRIGFRIGAYILLAGLGACTTAPPAAQYPDLTYGHHGKIALDVGEIEIVSQYVPPLKPPHVEHLAPVQPEEAMRRWVRDRLEATRPNGRARVTIKDARIVEVPLELTRGIRGFFTTDQSERYDAALEVVVEILDLRGLPQGFVRVRAERSRTVSEDASLADRERVWFEITEALMNELNTELESSIRKHLARFVR